MTHLATRVRRPFWTLTASALVFGAGVSLAKQPTPEVQERSRIAAANLEDAIVVDCQLPGKLQKLGGVKTYMTPGVLVRLSAVDCRARGGEYTIGDLSSGTLSLQRWLPLAQNGQPEAQYYVARIYANGMGEVQTNYGEAAQWYRRAADQNYTPALQELGYMYEQGLGVDKDTMLALNMQRKAAGLGDELDYAWKIAAAEEEGARQVAALSERLDASNSELETMRTQLRDTTNAVLRSRKALADSESALLDAREQLATAKEAPSASGNPAQVAELQKTLTAKEKDLEAAQTQVVSLTGQLRQQEAQLSSRMAESQVSSLELNELLSSAQAKNRTLEAQLAQADQRLLRSQKELGELRAQYRAEVDQLVAERADIDRAMSKSKDETQALLQIRERELARQQMRVATLEKALSDLTKQLAKAGTPANARATAQVEQDRAALTSLKAQVEDQQRQLKQRQEEITALRSRSKQDKEAAVKELNEQLAKRNDELEAKQRRLAALTSETTSLRSEVGRLTAQRTKEVEGVSDEAARARASLRVAQQKLNEQRERLDQLQVEKATETAALARARDELQQQLAANKKSSQMQVTFLSKDLEARQKDIESKDAEIARLESRLQDQTKAFNAMIAQNASPGTAGPIMANASVGQSAAGVKMRSADSRPTTTSSPLRASLPQLREQSAGRYHALVIGNSLYHYMEPLDTPAHDAREIATLLKQRYGFKVKLLLDATREQIMTALHEQKLELTAQDSLLIYYAGHGDVSDSGDRAFWLGVEADRDTRSGWLEADHIRAKIKEMDAKHVLLVADSCFSGAITHPKTTIIGRGLNETRLRVQWNRRARMVLTSGEVTPVADSAGDASHSVFARYFIQVLRTNDNIMSGEMLSHELSGRMLAKPVQVGGGQRQTPTYSALHDANHDMGDFFFVPAVAQTQMAANF